MKKRNVLRFLFYITSALFIMFCIWEIENAIIFFIPLLVFLIVLKVLEVIKFYKNKRRLVKLGEREFFLNQYIASFLILISFIVYVVYVSKFNFDLNTEFAYFFLGENGNSGFFYGLLMSLVIRGLFESNYEVYLTDKGIVKGRSYFEDYLWEDFLSFEIIKEQSLIRFKKKNDKFIFIKYEEDTFKNREDLIISKLNKNLTEDVKNINN
ncbi:MULTISPECIES: hypothetical protein [Tenacibaculum]|uniref:hypothetical protein n=1 Tax=Tenacibaculum TaxID=104267 RepID=UPI00089930DD|nr:hypothetical protein [Tenacibaculum sp. MAR_2010_89]SED64816.1 hypothetical protein SAMN04487765_0603 [Tenacibaculum sp. MAR_2010_89]